MDNKAYYFPNTLRKTNLAMLGLFSGITTAKLDAGGNELFYKRVPLRWAHRQKFIPLLSDNKESNRLYWIQNLPVMGLVLKNLTYNPLKARGGYNAPIFKWYSETDNGNKEMLAGTPYTATYELAILSLHFKELSMILEQILPTFNPWRNITIREWDFLPELTRDMKVNLKSTVPNFMDDVGEEQIRRYEFILSFDVDVFFYRPIPMVELIKSVNIDWKQWGHTDMSALTRYTVSGNELDAYERLEEYSWNEAITMPTTADGGTPDEDPLAGGAPERLWGGTPGSQYIPVEKGLPYANDGTITDGGSATLP